MSLGNEASPEKKAHFTRAVSTLTETLQDILNLADQGIEACNRYIDARTPLEKNHALEQLDRIDRKILSHPGKEIVAMVFSFAEKDQKGENPDNPILTTRALYQALVRATTMNLSELEKLH